MKKYWKPVLAFILFFALIALCFLPYLTAKENLKEALFYDKRANNLVQCRLCPRQCLICDGNRGFCGTRQNRGGVLYTLVYAKPVSRHIDPIEKKPFFHFLPSSSAYSIATAGCNLKCKFCQNWEISQSLPEELEYEELSCEELVKKVKESAAPCIAYTYSEPTIFFEYMLEIAKLARQQGIRNVMHSNGYINPEPLRELSKYLDAANIDLKGFSDSYYRELTEGTLAPVLESLKILRKEGVHIEITNLIVPGYNDDKDSLTKMCVWIRENLGPDTPLHFSRFSPMYKMVSLNPTPVETLEEARDIAIGCGLNYVYIGNVPAHPAENTYCPRCKKIVIERKGYFVSQDNLEAGKCKFCGYAIKGVWM